MVKPRHLALALTGASGTRYGLSLCNELLQAGIKVSLVITEAGAQVLKEEDRLFLPGDEQEAAQFLREYFTVAAHKLFYYRIDNLFSPLASGSSAPDGMVVCPCTMGTLSRIVCGHSGNLLERCADVMLKEKRPLVVVPRETPLNEIHLENMLKLARLGAHIVPAMPAFYHKPESMDDLVRFMVAKLLDILQIDNALIKRWGEDGADGGTREGDKG